MNLLRKNLPGILFLLAISLTFFLTFWLYSPPSTVSSDASLNQFSAERAFSHIKEIARAPHATGTEEHARVKEYIKNELLHLGLEYGEQNTTVLHDNWGINAGYISNLFGLLKGNGTGKKTVVFLGHYDSCPHTPGAADDGSAVTSMLEAARALTQSEPLENDIIFLFTDAEESGLFGAKAFVDEHSLMEKIGLIINIEARGSSGPTLAYEFNENNGWVIRELNRSMPRLFAASILYEIYKRMPNDTDFTMFRRAGVSGINLAFIDDYVNYHSMTDSPENLSLKSLQHHGDYIMSIAHHFGNLELEKTQSEDAVFFNWIGSSMIIYSSRLSMILIIIALGLSILYFYVGFRKQHIRWGRVLLGFLLFIATLASILFVSWLVLKGIKKGYSHYYNFNFYNAKYYFLLFSALSLAIFTGIYSVLFKYFRVMEYLSGIIAVNIILLLLLHFLIPTGSYLVLVPLLLLVLSGIICFSFNLSVENSRRLFLFIQFISVFPIITLILPYVSLFFIALGPGMIFGGIATLVLLCGYLMIPISLIIKTRSWIVPTLALIVALAGFLMAHFNSSITPERPMQTSLNYYFDGDSSRAFWVSEFTEPDEWNRQFFEGGVLEPLIEIYPNAERIRLKNSAPVVSMALPVLEISSDTVIESRRYVDLTLTTQRGAPFCELYFLRNYDMVISLVNDRPADTTAFSNWSGEYYTLEYHGFSTHPLSLSFNCSIDESIEFFVIERAFGIRDMESFNPMPEYIIPITGYNSYQEIVKKTWRF